MHPARSRPSMPGTTAVHPLGSLHSRRVLDTFFLDVEEHTRSPVPFGNGRKVRAPQGRVLGNAQSR